MQSKDLPNGSGAEQRDASAGKRSRTQKLGKRAAAGVESAVTTLQFSGKDALRLLHPHLHERPLVVLGVSAGASFLLGKLAGSRTLRVVALAGAAYALARMRSKEVRELLRRGVAQIAERAEKPR